MYRVFTKELIICICIIVFKLSVLMLVHLVTARAAPSVRQHYFEDRVLLLQTKDYILRKLFSTETAVRLALGTVF